RPGPRERADGGLARAVDAEGREAHRAGDRAVHDDRPAVIEERQGLLDGEEGPPDVHAEGLVELLLRHLADGRELAGPRAGEEDVDPAFLLPDPLVQAVEIGEAAGVALHAG